MNRLKDEKSPYLKMHSENPVDWYPWCEEAFKRAKAEDKPVFLSVGYSSCHWCHVIAHESFEDAEIAALLNADYISVKVDKEERPDVDAVYMDAVQLYSGNGGWPMTLLLTPEAEPFFAATYLPKESRDGVMGLKELLSAATALWQRDRASALNTASTLTRHMRALADKQPGEARPSPSLTQRALDEYEASFDDSWGGFGSAPKFPSAHNLLFLLSRYRRTGDERALSMTTATLDAMSRGGIFDHVGGGFCRYSTDRKWLTPHFEKMLYDNALLLWAYAEAWSVTGNRWYKSIAERTADYVLREMTSPEGAFFSAQDADSRGREGAYYIFTPDEIREALGDEAGERFCEWYGITPDGNFEGGSIPNLIGNPRYREEDGDMPALRQRVYEYRLERMPLGLDDKVLTSWNALMIAALCVAARTLQRSEYIDAARRAEEFIRLRLIAEDGGLLLRYRDGEAKGGGVLADYAYYALALTELYISTADYAYLERAQTIASQMLRRFGDGDAGGLLLYSNSGERLITRPKELWDGAMPSGNACAALVLRRLANETGKPDWDKAADRQLAVIAGAAKQAPTGHGFGLLAIEEALLQIAPA